MPGLDGAGRWSGPLGPHNVMSEPSIPFWLSAILTVTGLIGIVGYVWCEMRRKHGEEFSLLRIVGVALAAICVSLPFVATWWWLEPRQANRHSPLLLAAFFVPIAVLEVWGFVIAWQKRRKV
jgi:hypothetical protein